MSDALERLPGAELAAVWFVRDYLQLIFEHAHGDMSLQCWVWPVVVRDSAQVHHGMLSYRDEVCAAIGLSVAQISTGRGVVIHFPDRSFSLDPSLEDVAGPEIAMLHTLDRIGDAIVWRPGEDSFRHLDQ